MAERTSTRNPDELNAAQRAQRARDLRSQVAELNDDPEAQREIIFRDNSPRLPKVTIYSMTDGEELRIPRALMDRTLEKRDPATGKFMFTAFKDEAPAYKLGEVKCFLHPDAAERPILDEIGLFGKTCPAAHLASRFSRRIHAMHRHKQEWGMYQDYLEEEKDLKAEERQTRQIEAMESLAKKAAS